MTAQPRLNPYSGLKGKKLLICIPSGNQVDAHFMVSIASLTSHTALHGVGIGVMNEVSSVISKGRNTLVARALPYSPDFILQIDSDMIFPPDIALKLMMHDLDIVGATYCRRAPPYSILGKLKGPAEDDIQGGLREASFLPGGMMLVKPAVFESLGYPWYFETYDWEGADSVASLIRMLADWSWTDLPLPIRTRLATDPEVRAWVEASVAQREKEMSNDAKMIAEDYNFCRKARKGGYKLFCDFDATFTIAHIGEQIIPLERKPLAGETPSPESSIMPTEGDQARELELV